MTAERRESHDADAGGYIEARGVVGILLDLHATGAHFDRVAQQLLHIEAQLSGEFLPQQFQRRQPSAHHMVLARQIVDPDFRIGLLRIRRLRNLIDTGEQCFDFFPREDFPIGHGYCRTKLVRSTLSIP